MEVLLFSGRTCFFGVALWGMKELPVTGTSALLEKLSPHVPDDLINLLLAQKSRRGRPRLFSAAQLFRVNLLALLTPAHSFNLLVALLAEHRPWRSFARLRNRLVLPDARMLHDFRDRLDLAKLRCINKSLLTRLLDDCDGLAKTVSLIDATDLPAATNSYKKTRSVSTVPNEPIPVLAVARMDRAVTLLDIKSTRFGYGFDTIVPAFYWSR